MIENAFGAWISVADAAILAKRSPMTIYRWAEKKHIRSDVGTDGVTRVWGADVIGAESKMKRGRTRKRRTS